MIFVKVKIDTQNETHNQKILSKVISDTFRFFDSMTATQTKSFQEMYLIMNYK